MVNVKPSISLKSIWLSYSLFLSSQLDFFSFFQTKVLRSIAGKRKISKMLFFVCFFLEQVYFHKKIIGLIQESFRELLAGRGQGQCNGPNANEQNHLFDYNCSITIISHLSPTAHYCTRSKNYLIFWTFFLMHYSVQSVI